MGQMPSTTWLTGSGRCLSSADHLCDDCSSLGYEIRQLCKVRDFKITKLKASVERNSSTCAFCQMIVSEVPFEVGSKQEIFISSHTRSPDGINRLHITGGWRSSSMVVSTTKGKTLFLLLGDRERCLGLIVDPGSAPATAHHVSGRCIKPASNLDRAKDWLSECLYHHNHDNIAVTRPSRLVAVGTAYGSEYIKIVDGSNTNKEYLAVSYRWGSETLLTTTETLELFQTSLPWRQLPQTFQDAIKIARELGIGYLWIDSLCIIQDSLADWEVESAKMATIYKGALLTIMAASASDSQGGLFRDREPINSVALPYTNFWGRTERSVFVSKRVPSFEHLMSASPLFQRGWVFQERLMSKRKLIFGEDQTYWECNGVVLSESGPQERGKIESQDRLKYAALRVFSDSRYKVPRSNGKISPTHLWADVVERYSPCALTYEADRLPALSGLARTFAQRFGSSYAAGLWQDQMPESLLWRVVSQASKKTYQGVYCAPSWSWASTMGAVSFHLGFNLELDVISIDTKLAGRNRYGRVCPGSSMYVRGRLCSGRIVKGKTNGPTVCLETEHGRFRSSTYLDRDDQDLPLEVDYLEVTSGQLETHWYACCLLLRTTGEDKHFRRVGMAELDFVDRDDDYLFHGLQKEVITLV